MEILVPHEMDMVKVKFPAPDGGVPSHGASEWLNGGLTEQERANIGLIRHFWRCWEGKSLDVDGLADLLAPNVTVRTGWRGEHVVQGRDTVLAAFKFEVARQAEHGEDWAYRFPVWVAKGPVVFHTWVWISRSESRGYHIERAMAAMFVLTNGQIERWDSYSTGPEAEADYVASKGPDGL